MGCHDTVQNVLFDILVLIVPKNFRKNLVAFFVERVTRYLVWIVGVEASQVALVGVIWILAWFQDREATIVIIAAMTRDECLGETRGIGIE